jgi:hypothetical protein
MIMLVLTLQMVKCYTIQLLVLLTQDALDASKDKKYAGSILPNATTYFRFRTIKTLIYQLTAMELQGKVYNGKRHNVLQEKI